MVTKQIAQFVSTLKFEAIPATVVATAKRGILDFLGVAVAGSGSATGKIVMEYVASAGQSSEASIIASSVRTNCELAALANGAFGHALDFDDVSESWNSHPTSVIFPAVLALAEKTRSGAKDVLSSYIAGWEVAARLGPIIYRAPDRAGHATPIVGTVAAAAAAARILNLNTEQTQMAIGIAASQAAGVRANDGTDTKPLHAGFSASNGVRSAKLAQLGLTAHPNIIEDPFGYLAAMAGKDHPLPDVDSLGRSFDLAESLCIKSSPCCYNNQRPIDSIVHLMKQHKLRSEDIAEVEMKAHPHQERKCRFTRPRTGLEAKFSLTYSLAAPIVFGHAGLNDYTDEKVRDPRITELLPRIKISHVDAQDAAQPYRHCGNGQLVTVRLKDGRQYSYDIERPRGHASNPFSWEEIAAKFTSCAEYKLSADSIKRCIELVDRFESLKDMSALLASIRTSST